MQCPKCGLIQNPSPSCTSCGIDVGKYEERLEQSRKESAERSAKVSARVANARRAQQSNRSIPWIVISIAGAIGLFIWLLIPDDSQREVAGSDSTASELSGTVDFNPAQNSNDITLKSTSLAARLESSIPTKNAIERARNATVFIQTAWGTLGSGFIINRECDVVTNRHVMDQNYASANSESGGVYQVLLKQGQDQILHQIDKLEVQRNIVLERVSAKNIKALSLQEEIDQLRRQLRSLPNKIRSELDNSNSRASTQINSKVSLVDGSSYDVPSVEFSEKVDLAMFRLPEDDCPYLELGDANQLSLGTPVYTIGSPSGLIYTVTSGIFSGFRQNLDFKYLQTDAPINPGNSGGPLITENGKVVGINTAILTGTEGIGFSLPIEYVFSEF